MKPSSSASSSKRKRDSDSFEESRSYERLKNDVFINYYFEDTGNGFVSHLKGSLTRNGFTISDHNMLPIGEDKSSELLKAIEESEICLVVFSINYAFSIECLDELVLIMDCLSGFKKKKVFPVFLNVDPSHVRSQQEGSFMEAFQAHKSNFNPERVEKWKQALKHAGQLSGVTLQNGDERKFLSDIVKLLKKMRNPLELFDATHPVGIESRAQDLISKLRLGDNVFTIVAVLGIGGSGKTTIVKAVYDRIAADFDVPCFIENIHDYKSSGRNWKVDLQKKVISHLTGSYKFHEDGAAGIRKLLTTQKVLLVLDDVDDFEQLRALYIHLAPFGCESRIIVTTRDKKSLSNLPYTLYEISLLNDSESFELFTKFAFGKDEAIYKNFVEEIVWRAEGLPLVLEVWGRHFKCHERKQWPSILETLKRIPHETIQKKLQISYDSLTNRAKKLFLDIAFFFYMMKKDLVVIVLQDEDLAFFPENEIQYLVDKGLVRIDYFNELSMHHAIREMGEEVVRSQNEVEPGQRSRVMGDKDVVRVLRDCSGTELVEGIRLGNHEMEEPETVQVEAFKNMSNLRFIQLLDRSLQWSSSSSSSNGGMSPFSFKKLKYMEWKKFPCKNIDIDMGNAVVIILQDSKLEIFREGFKSLKKLRILDVSYSRSLTKIGNFIGLDKLEQLYLKECEKLEELHSSIGCLEKLISLDLSQCTSLKRFPCEMIGKLRSLQALNLSNCPQIGLERDDVIEPFLSSLKECCITGLDLSKCKISKISGEVGSLKSLKYLNLSGNIFASLPDSLCQLQKLKTIDLVSCPKLKSFPNLPPTIREVTTCNCISLENLPSNISDLQFLSELYLDGCFKLNPEDFMKVTRLRNLYDLSMSNCNMSQVSTEIGNLLSLWHLNLSENPFSRLPDSFVNLSQLRSLVIKDCSQLELLPLLPLNLTKIEASGCCSLTMTPYYDSTQTAYKFRSKWFEESFFTEDEAMWIGLSGEVVPEWCSYRNKGDVLSLEIPRDLDKKICGVILCATTKWTISDSDSGFRECLAPRMVNKSKETDHEFIDVTFIPSSMCVVFCPLNDTTLVVEPGDTVLLRMAKQRIIDLSEDYIPEYEEDDTQRVVLSCGLRLIYEGDVLDDDDSTLLIQKQLTESLTDPVLG